MQLEEVEEAGIDRQSDEHGSDHIAGLQDTERLLLAGMSMALEWLVTAR